MVSQGDDKKEKAGVKRNVEPLRDVVLATIDSFHFANIFDNENETVTVRCRSLNREIDAYDGECPPKPVVIVLVVRNHRHRTRSS